MASTDEKKLLKAEIVHAYRRTSSELDTDLDIIIQDLQSVFQKEISISSVINAIKKGSTGLYGRTYKMSFQEICVWVRCYKNDCKPNDLLKSRN